VIDIADRLLSTGRAAEMVRFASQIDELVGGMVRGEHFEDALLVLADRLGECLRIHVDRDALWEFLRGVVEGRAKIREN
jgi:hypothetical protein